MNEVVISEAMLCDLRRALLLGENESAAILLAQEVTHANGKSRLLVREALYPDERDYNGRSCKGRSKIRPEGGAKQGHQGGVAARAA